MRGGLFALTGAVFTADQILKRKVEEDLSQGQVGRIGPRFIITRSRNRGAAMNLGEKNPELITAASGLVLTAAHPSPLSANRGGFFGNHHFSRANDYLVQHGMAPIVW